MCIGSFPCGDGGVELVATVLVRRRATLTTMDNRDIYAELNNLRQAMAVWLRCSEPDINFIVAGKCYPKAADIPITDLLWP